MSRRCLTLVILALHATSALVLNGPMPAVNGRAGPIAMKKASGAKAVTVLLEADVDGLGVKGTLVQVKPAYAENVLISKGMGSVASKETIERVAKEAEEAKVAAAAAKKRARDDRDAITQKLGKGLVTEVQVGKEGEIIDSVTSVEIAADIKNRAGVTVEPSCIEMPEVTELGSVVVDVTLHPEVSVSIKLTVEKSKIVFM